MDIALIVGKALDIVTPLFLEHVGGKLTDAAIEHAKKLWETLKSRFSGDPVVATNLSSFEKKPPVWRPAISAMLEEKLGADPALVEEIQKLIEAAGPALHVKVEVGEGNGLVGLEVENFKGGQADAEVRANKLESSTGAKIKNFGG